MSRNGVNGMVGGKHTDRAVNEVEVLEQVSGSSNSRSCSWGPKLPSRAVFGLGSDLTSFIEASSSIKY